MLEFLTPRERALVRALRRMARARPKSIYREAAMPDDATEAARLAAWVGKVAPGAQAFVMEGTGQAMTMPAPPPGAPPSPEAIREVQEARNQAKKSAGMSGRTRIALIGVTLAVMLLAVWKLLEPAQGGVESSDSGGEVLTSSVVLAFVLVSILVLVQRLLTLSDHGRRLLAAQVDLARGKIEPAMVALEALTRTQQDTIAAGAHLALAQLAERSSRWADPSTIRARDRAPLEERAAQGRSVRCSLPRAARNACVCARGVGPRGPAAAEIATMDAECPSYVHAARAHFRIGLLSAVRGGDLPRAADLARARAPELPLSLRDDMLADVVLAATSVVSKDERERIDAELENDAPLRAWIDGVAPACARRHACASPRRSRRRRASSRFSTTRKK